MNRFGSMDIDTVGIARAGFVSPADEMTMATGVPIGGFVPPRSISCLVDNHIGLEGDAVRDYYIYYIRREGQGRVRRAAAARQRESGVPQVTWILKDGRKITADVKAGHNLMEAAVANNVPNVIGECGGCLSCATCHVYVDETWYEKAGQPDDMERDMLEITAAERRPTSRLSCQIQASDALDGIVLHVPEI